MTDILNQKFKFAYLDKDDVDKTDILTGQEILDLYFNDWSEKMKKVGKEHMISKELCIEDWVVVNWAWKVD